MIDRTHFVDATIEAARDVGDAEKAARDILFFPKLADIPAHDRIRLEQFVVDELLPEIESLPRDLEDRAFAVKAATMIELASLSEVTIEDAWAAVLDVPESRSRLRLLLNLSRLRKWRHDSSAETPNGETEEATP